METEQSLRMVREAYLWGPRVRGSDVVVPVRIAGRRAAVSEIPTRPRSGVLLTVREGPLH